MPNHDLPRRRGKMKKMWKKPKVVEIAVGMEINSYACAELKK
jgi:coenzyme PQQ precursor peptide PqqA